MDPDKHHSEKLTLVATAAFGGLIVFVACIRNLGFVLAALVGVACSFVYVFSAADAVEAYIKIRSWAYCGKCERPSDSEILRIAAFWPFMLFGGGLIFTFIGIINRSFK